MVELAAADRTDLLNILKELPEFASERDRRELVRNAGLQKLAAHIDLDGSPYAAASRLVNYAQTYGRVSSEHEALGLIVNLVLTLTGIRNQNILDGILDRYGLMTPIARQPDPIIPKEQGTGAQFSEKIIGENTLRPVSFLSEGVRAASAVAYIEVRLSARRWSGTGFLLAPGLLMTNHHVISCDTELRCSMFRFGYENDGDGNALQVTDYDGATAKLLHSSQKLDFSLISVDGSCGQRWGWLAVSPSPPHAGDRVNIIQHPGGQPKQVTVQHNRIVYEGGSVIQYLTSTLPGSSGAPVLDDRWRVVAIHHSGGQLLEPTTGHFFYRNEGILAASILDDLPEDLRTQTAAGAP
ncbi:trypsin-like peptidase domain-containing protein [Kitasatospora sp. NPDC056181]|uniref:trypsin-like peptidase domain-containing protein n=1 Tax=Kitasatospora sp. NPDC056181 TaxID=3345737 RepID=UPI0035E1207A